MTAPRRPQVYVRAGAHRRGVGYPLYMALLDALRRTLAHGHSAALRFRIRQAASVIQKKMRVRESGPFSRRSAASSMAGWTSDSGSGCLTFAPGQRPVLSRRANDAPRGNCYAEGMDRLRRPPHHRRPACARRRRLPRSGAGRLHRHRYQARTGGVRSCRAASHFRRPHRGDRRQPGSQRSRPRERRRRKPRTRCWPSSACVRAWWRWT